MITRALELAEEIRQTGRRSPQELAPLISEAERLASELEDPFSRGVCVRAIGSAHQLLNDFTTALEKYDSALEQFELANDPVQIGRTLLAKVGPLCYLSRLDELFQCARKAQELFEEQDDEASLSRLNVNLGNAYRNLDLYHEALDRYEQAVPMLERMGDREGLLAAVMNAAVVLMTLHDFPRAEEFYEQALKLSIELGMHALELQCRYNQTYLDYLKGNAGRALRRMLELRQQFDMRADDHHVCHCLLDESEILLEIGDLSESIQSARQARGLGEELGLHYEMGKALLFEAVALLRSGENGDATNLLDEAIRLFELDGKNAWTATSQLQAALFRGENGQASALSDAASARKVLEEKAMTGQVALADIVIGRIQRSNGNIECAIDSFQSAVRLSEQSHSQWMQFHAYQELGVTLSRTNNPEAIPFLKKAEAMLDSLWQRVGSDDLKMAFMTDRDNVYTHLVADIVATAPDEAFRLSEKSRSRVLVERLASPDQRTGASDIPGSLDHDESLIEYFIAGDDLYIFLIDSDGSECFPLTNVVGSIRREWEYLDRHIASCSVAWERLNRVAGQLQKTALSHLKQLDEYLLAPVRPYLKKHIVIVPHGFLNKIPFQALYDGHSFLSENHTVVYSPSARLYVSPAPLEKTEAALFVAFSTDAREGIIDEVEHAARTFPDAVVLINPSVAELSDAMSHRRSLLHIAGHAGVDPVRGSLSWLETPDGRLTSRDLIDMRFSADTIVVTGCRTAQRTISAGDEWLGLMRAFYLAGAHTIVSAHWAIRDESAQLFSRTFYDNYNAINTISAAQAAASAIREEFPHPYFWAGFGTFARKRGGATNAPSSN